MASNLEDECNTSKVTFEDEQIQLSSSNVVDVGCSSNDLLKKDKDLQLPTITSHRWIKSFILPPIIGEICDDTKRSCSVILFFVSRRTRNYNLSLLDVGNSTDEIWMTATCRGLRGHVTRIELNDIDRYKHYLVRWSCNSTVVYEHALSTFRPETIAFVCCDMPELDTRHSLWSRLRDNPCDIVVHLGDNIYGDYAWQRSCVTMETDDAVKLSKAKASVRTFYQSVYHNTWQKWAPKCKNSSHLMIWDDHDVTDGHFVGKWIGSHSSSDVVKRRVSAIAEDLYQEYQLSLLQNKVHLPSGSYAKWIDEETMLYIAPRISNKDGQPLTSELFTDIAAQSHDARRLILAFTTAPLPRASGFSFEMYKRIYGTDGLWKTDDALMLYSFCFDWLLSNRFDDPGTPHGRQLIVLGGDIHIGIETFVSNGEVEFPIYVTGPITNAPTLAETLYARAIKGHNNFGDMVVNVKDARAIRNYFEFSLQSFTGKLIWSEDTLPARPYMLPIVAQRMLGIGVQRIQCLPPLDYYDEAQRKGGSEDINNSAEAKVLTEEELKVVARVERRLKRSKERSKGRNEKKGENK